MDGTATETDRLVAELDALLAVGPSVQRQELPAKADALVEEPQGGVFPPPAAAEATQEPRPSRNIASRILIADDSKDYREIVSYLLSQNGFKVQVAKDGNEGLGLIRSDPPDLVLLDFEMPGINGYELLRELRSHEETLKLPVIMLTGARNRRHLKEEVRLDVADFLEKPITNSQLLESVTRVLRSEPRPPEVLAQTAVIPPEHAASVAKTPEANPASLPVQLQDQDAALAGVMLDSLGVSAGEGDLLIEEQKREQEEEVPGLDTLANDSPVVSRVNRMLVLAVSADASDIHIEPQEKHITVRIRVNGSLRQLCRFPSAMSPQISARIKIMSNLTITERRRPQDGQFRANIRGKKVDFRVSTVPGIYGEKIVIRVLGQTSIQSKLESLGMSQRDYEVTERALHAPNGLILVTGPTGSGKTTTLYTMIHKVNKPDVNIMTVEDPVEYELPGITQVHVKPQIGLTFEAVLRSFLRQDPNVMLVGEIRDLETANIAVKASITGHVVFSTLHTNSAPGAIVRLTHMGVAPYLLADSIKLIIAQRLVRTICPACRTTVPVTEEERHLLTAEEAQSLREYSRGRGCSACQQTGYSGRKPLFEVMPVCTAAMRHCILTSSSADPVAEQAIKEGMTSLRQAALRAVADGEIALSEAMRIVMAE